MEKICRSLLDTAKANRLENDQKRQEYNQLQAEKNRLEEEQQALRRNYTTALEYATVHKEQVEALKAGKDRDEVTRDQMAKVTQQIRRIVQAEEAYKQQAEAVAKLIETDIILPRLASILQDETELIENYKASMEEQKKELLTETQIGKVVDQVIEVLTRRGLLSQQVNRDALVNVVRLGQQEAMHVEDLRLLGLYGYGNPENPEKPVGCQSLSVARPATGSAATGGGGLAETDRQAGKPADGAGRSGLYLDQAV